jgi:transcriptional regulator with XRE-family HTH domain
VSTTKSRKKFQFSAGERKELGARLRKVRGDRTIYDMAETHGISPSYWSKLECGMGSAPSMNLLELIAIKESLDLGWLLVGKGEAPEPGKSTVHSLRELAGRRASGVPLKLSVVDHAIEEAYKILTDEETRKSIQTLSKRLGQSELATVQWIVAKTLGGNDHG